MSTSPDELPRRRRRRRRSWTIDIDSVVEKAVQPNKNINILPNDKNSVFGTSPATEFFATVALVTLDPQMYIDEITMLHETRLARKLTFDRNVNINNIRKANAQEAANRSRLTAILMEVHRIVERIKPLRDAVILQLLTRYPELCPPTTKNEKRDYIVYGFDKRLPLLNELYNVIDTAQYVIDDIDQCAYSIQRDIKIFELITRPEVHN